MADNQGYAEHHASVTVDAPVHQVYSMFTHFNDFPKFMHFVKEVTYYDDQNSHWVAEIFGRHEWDAVNQDWVEDQQVGWRSTSGTDNYGKVAFQPTGSNQTKVDVYVYYNPPAGVLGDVGENLGAGARFDNALQHDLDNFAKMVREAPAGALDPESSNYLFHSGSAAATGTTTGRQDATMQDDTSSRFTTARDTMTDNYAPDTITAQNTPEYQGTVTDQYTRAPMTQNAPTDQDTTAIPDQGAAGYQSTTTDQDTTGTTDRGAAAYQSTTDQYSTEATNQGATGYQSTTDQYSTGTTDQGTTGYQDTTSTDTEGERSLRLREEELRAQKQPVEAGEVHLRKDVVTEEKTIDVPTTREEVYVERRPGSGDVSDKPIGEGETINVPVREEQVMVEKQPVVREEISLGKRAVQENQQVTDTVRREEAHVERAGDVDVQKADNLDVTDQQS
jgi:uncharacterized protein (TIGR02271 family)